MEPTFDEHGMPTRETLDTISNWPIHKGYGKLLEFIKNCWNTGAGPLSHGSWSVMSGSAGDGPMWVFTTGRRHDNEAIIDAVKRNRFFCEYCWESSIAGGVHYFVPPGEPSWRDEVIAVLKAERDEIRAAFEKFNNSVQAAHYNREDRDARNCKLCEAIGVADKFIARIKG